MLNNTEILCFVLGLQGGTIHQVADTIHEDEMTILDAGTDEMRTLCRIAQCIKEGIVT